MVPQASWNMDSMQTKQLSQFAKDWNETRTPRRFRWWPL